MSKISKKHKAALGVYDTAKSYQLKEAVELVKKITYTKFNASVDIDVRLGVDPKQANQMVRGVASLPHGIGKEVRVLVLANADKEADAKGAGADYFGLDDYISKIEKGWTDIDVIICTPDVMAKVGRLGRVLGPRGLMPNPKSGTVTTDVAKAVTEVKAGKIDFKVDKTGIIHTTIGKVDFTPEMLTENAIELIQVLSKLKPSSSKGTYFRSISLSSTIIPGVKVEKASVPGI
jgi:large subunit ribosomal protein L1